MSVNTAHANNGVLIHSGEYILLFSDKVAMEFIGQSNPVFAEKKTGRIYLTSHRMIFNSKAQSDPLQSFSFPFIVLTDVELEQPVFGANYIKGKVHAQPNGNWTGEVKFKLHFKAGGAIEFGQALLRAAKTAQCNSRLDAPPPYTPPSGNWYEAPSPAYQPPPGYYGWLPTNDGFSHTPPAGGVFMSDNPPPYPGIDTPHGGQPGYQGYPGAPPPQYGYPGAPPYSNPQQGYGGSNGYPGAQPGFSAPQTNGYPGAQPGFSIPQTNGYPSGQPGIGGSQPNPYSGGPGGFVPPQSNNHSGGGHPGYPGGQPGYPGSQPGYPGSQPGYPGGQQGYPGGQQGYPGGQQGYPGAPPNQYPGTQPSSFGFTAPGQQDAPSAPSGNCSKEKEAQQSAFHAPGYHQLSLNSPGNGGYAPPPNMNAPPSYNSVQHNK